MRIHDLRHEGISRVAESGKFPTILDLQAFSGHRDLRSLSRYTHLCTTALAIRADEAEAERLARMDHNGRMRLKQSTLLNLGGATLSIRESSLQQNDVLVEEPTVISANVLPFRASLKTMQT